MNYTSRRLGLLLVCCATASAAHAQQAPTPNSAAPKPSAQSEAGEPRADTSEPTPMTAAPAAAAPVTAAAPAAVAPGRTAPGKVTAGRSAPGPGQKPGGSDRLDLGTATVTGSQEQPKVMYIVPWKRSDIGDLAGKPMNSLVDEILAPVDREVFKREVVYYQAVQADASQNGASPKSSQQGEK